MKSKEVQSILGGGREGSKYAWYYLIYDYTQEIDVHSMLYGHQFLNKYMKLLKVVTLGL